MQRLEVSGAVQPIYGSLGVKRIIFTKNSCNHLWRLMGAHGAERSVTPYIGMRTKGISWYVVDFFKTTDKNRNISCSKIGTSVSGPMGPAPNFIHFLSDGKEKYLPCFSAVVPPTPTPLFVP